MENGKQRSQNTIKKKIKIATKGKWVGGGRAKYAGFGDPRYYLPTNSEVVEFLSSQIYPGFIEDAFDCEDFAFVCKANVSKFQQVADNVPERASICLGIVWGRFSWIGSGNIDHACNWLVDDTGKFLWYEPQTDTFFDASEATNNQLRLMLV